MCNVYAQADESRYGYITRSIRLNGYVTSIRLEALFWDVLDDMAAAEGRSTPSFIATLYDEVVRIRGGVGNFTSHLRIACLIYLERRAPIAAAVHREAATLAA